MSKHEQRVLKRREIIDQVQVGSWELARLLFATARSTSEIVNRGVQHMLGKLEIHAAGAEAQAEAQARNTVSRLRSETSA